VGQAFLFRQADRRKRTTAAPIGVLCYGWPLDSRTKLPGAFDGAENGKARAGV